MTENLPLIFNIHRFALNDGPGIRTTIFMKGCPLSCSWCHNPEAVRAEKELACYPDRCARCGSCEELCAVAAISHTPGLQVDRDLCVVCGSCEATCPANAIQAFGKEYHPEQLLELILRDRHYYAASGGGVTFSGGEPTLRMDYLNEVLRGAKKENLHTAIQTCGMFDYDEFARKILPNIDLIMYDLKFFDAEEHQRHTGADNRMILENFRRLTRDARKKVLPRIPMVPGITATTDNLQEIAAFLSELGFFRCDLLPYNGAGVVKRHALGMELPENLPRAPLGREEEAELRQIFQARLKQRFQRAA